MAGIRCVRCLVIGLLAVAALAGCAAGASTSSSSGRSINISKATWHDGEWPFTVRSGTLSCAQPPYPGAVTFTANGTVYGINGTALDAHAGIDVKPIWKRGRLTPRVYIGGVIDKGLTLCPK